MNTIDVSSIRKQNLCKLLDHLTLAPAMTRQELAEAADLSQMTVTNLVELLNKQGVLRLTPVPRDENSRYPQGRRAKGISLCGSQKAWLIVDISGCQFNMTLLGFDLEILLEIHDNHKGEYLQRLENFLSHGKELIQSALSGRELIGVAIVAPGPYAVNSDTVMNQRLPQLNGIRIKDLFCRCFGHYDYYVDEDVKFAVRSFSDPTMLNECELLYYLYIGEGVGGAAIHRGDMLRGLNATAGDAGRLIDSKGGIYENRLSTEAFLGLFNRQELLSTEEFHEAVQQIASLQHSQYLIGLDNMAALTAEMLHSVLWILDPSHVIIDCFYAHNFENAFVEMVDKHLVLLFKNESRLLPKFLSCTSNISSVLRGAVRVLQHDWIERTSM